MSSIVRNYVHEVVKSLGYFLESLSRKAVKFLNENLGGKFWSALKVYTGLWSLLEEAMKLLILEVYRMIMKFIGGSCEVAGWILRRFIEWKMWIFLMSSLKIYCRKVVTFLV